MTTTVVAGADKLANIGRSISKDPKSNGEESSCGKNDGQLEPAGESSMAGANSNNAKMAQCTPTTSSTSSSTNTSTSSGTSTTTSTTANNNKTETRKNGSTTAVSKFKEKRPEPLKFANLNQEIPLDLSVKR